MSILGLDVGTTGCKASVFDEKANVLSYAYREYPLITPRTGWLELDANVVWDSIVSVVRQAASQISRNDPVQAMSVSSMGDTITPVTAQLQPVHNSILAFDTRTERQAQQLKEKLGTDKVYQITGMPIHTINSICKILWIKQERPEVYARTWKFLSYEDFVLTKLGLEPTICYPLAGRTMAFDEVAKTWSSEILDAVEISADKFSRPVPSGTLLGVVNSTTASSLGLPKGVTAVAGGHDVGCGAIGTGVVEPGLIHASIGTTENIAGVFQDGIKVAELLKSNCCWYHHSVPDMFIIVGYISSAGSVLRWYRDTFGSEEKLRANNSKEDPYTVMINMMSDQPSPTIVVPYFAGSGTPTLDPRARGVIYGLALDSTRSDVVKGILQGICHESAWNLQLMEQSGLSIKEIRCTGGGARSDDWLQLRADITGRPVVAMSIDEGSSLGAAILAGVGIGIYSSVLDAVKQVVKVKKVYQPDAKKRPFYAEQGALYRTLIINISKAWQH
jgi:xylulokinase